MSGGTDRGRQNTSLTTYRRTIDHTVLSILSVIFWLSKIRTVIDINWSGKTISIKQNYDIFNTELIVISEVLKY